MIYQMKIYYGAMLNEQAIYSTVTTLKDCTKLPDEINEDPFRDPIIAKIKKDGFNPEDFEIRFLTEDEYENRFDKENEVITTFNFEKNY